MQISGRQVFVVYCFYQHFSSLSRIGKGNFIGFLTTILDAFYLFLEYIFTSIYCEVT